MSPFLIETHLGHVAHANCSRIAIVSKKWKNLVFQPYLISVLILVGGCTPKIPHEATGLFKVEITAKINGKKSTGSSVWRIALDDKDIPFSGRPNITFDAEAIPVRLPGGAWLFFLPMDTLGNWADSWITSSFPIFDDSSGNDVKDPVESMQIIAKNIGMTREYKCDPTLASSYGISGNRGLCPIVIYSNDVRNKRSFRVKHITNNKEYRNSIFIDRISITVVHNRYNNSLYKIIPWLKDMDDNRSPYMAYEKIEDLPLKELEYIRYPTARLR